MPVSKHLIAAAILTTVSGVSIAEESNVIENVGPMSDVSAYWTEEAMANAKTLLPMIEGNPVEGQSYGTANLDFTRSRILPQNANTAKGYRLAGKLYFTIPGQGNYQCTASVIGRRLIATAAHCMYTNGVGFHTNWQFIPAFDGTKPAGTGNGKRTPYGTWNWSYGIIPVQWITSAGALPNNEDFGILELVDQAVPPSAVVKNISAYIGKFTPLIGRLFDNHVTMLGYPCNFDSCNIMQRNDSSDHRLGAGTAYEYGSDMTGGSSGGPWVQNFGNPDGAAPTGFWTERNAIIAVTSYGYVDPNVKILGASQFNANFQSILNSACAHQPGNC